MNRIERVISPQQSAFIPGRLITDNIMIAHEIHHQMQAMGKKKQAYASIKLDMSKAYDRVEWSYLEAVMRKIGFPDRWVAMIMHTVTTVTYGIQFQGEESCKIVPTRGLRQGDPLSPYLFLLCSEGLTCLLKDAEVRGSLHGIKISRSALEITHLLYADDSLVVCLVEPSEAQELKELFNLYEECSGQKINMEKSDICFSSNTDPDCADEFSAIIGISNVPQHARYLGLPSLVGRSPTASFAYLRDRVVQRLLGYKGNLLSKGGREVLLKSVIQSMPTFAMSVFKIPKEICEDIEVLMNKFWWGKGEQSRGIPWMCWTRLSVSKDMGGMGFRSLREFNLALLAKQGWRFLTNPNSLVSKFYKEKYFPNEIFLDAQLGTNPSYIWKSIMASKELLQQSTRKRVGDGRATRIWGDKWLPLSPHYIRSPKPYGCWYSWVCQLIEPLTNNWNLILLQELFTQQTVQQIMAIPRPHEETSDSWVWIPNKDGVFTVKSGYHVATNIRRGMPPDAISEENRQYWRALWSVMLPSKIKIFLWRLCRDVLPVLTRLRDKRVYCSTQCALCDGGEETALHLFRDCPFARAVWFASSVPLISTNISANNFWSFFVYVCRSKSDGVLLIFLVTCWIIWKNRNEVVWNEKQAKPQHVQYHVASLIKDFHMVMATTRKPRAVDSVIPPANRWKPPPFGALVLNVDAAVFDGTQSCGTGALIRDENGDVIAAMSCPHQGKRDPFHAEALALLTTLQWVRNMFIAGVHVQLDCLNLVNAIKSPDGRWTTEVQFVIRECKRLVANLGIPGIEHISRTANLAAHCLARFAGQISQEAVWEEDIPPCISREITADRPV